MTPLPSNEQRAKGRRLKRPTKVTPARWVAWLTLKRTFEEEAWTDRAFTAAVEQLGLDKDPRERAFAQRLTYGTVQQAKRLDHVIGVLGKRPLHKLDPPVLYALRIGTYELLELQQATGPDGERLGTSSAHAAVDQAVELVRGVVGERAVAFTNAILRRAQVDGAGILDKLDPAKDDELAVLLSMPDWLVSKVRGAHGEQGIEALRAQNAPHPGTVFRINTVDPAAKDVGAQLARNSVEHELLDGGGVRVFGSTSSVSSLVERGVLVPQSLASQLVAAAVDPQPGERVLDMCAAPGGKTTHLAALMQGSGSIVAVELHEHRADSIAKLAERTGTAAMIDVRVADATQLDPTDIGTFDRVLVDAPCSGTGVLGARPDARWKRNADGLAELADLQRALLDRAAQLVKPGGVVVYSTCSILTEEDEAITAQTPVSLVTDPLPDAFGSMLTSPNTARTWPHEHATDGFYIARFRRAADGPAT
ncbi:MAG: rsmB [Thermoleophilia bacterium]|nr:rsmB [Thermoleophilia bacterium]